MGYKHQIKPQTRQKLTIRKLAIVLAFSSVFAVITVMVIQLKNPENAYAVSCENSYVLNWSVPSTYTVNCGSVNSSNWTVKGGTCFYYSPVFNVGGNVGDPDKIVDISVRINQSGNLEQNDTAWVYIYRNNSIINTYLRAGDSLSSVFTINMTAHVFAGGTYRVVVKCKNDKTNETWQIKNGEVTACLRPLVPLPVSLISFDAKALSNRQVSVKWVTKAELNNDHYILERSHDGFIFNKIAKVQGAGTTSSTSEYYFTDKNPLIGINYYRLTQVDFNGTATLYPMVTAKIDNKSFSTVTPGQLKVYPNPFLDQLNITFESESEEMIQAELLSVKGDLLHSESIQSDLGLNRIQLHPASDLPTGIYLVRVRNDKGELGTSRVIKK